MLNIKKFSFLVIIVSLVLANPVWSAVNITSGPSSLITSPVLVKASSQPIGLFWFDLAQTAGETLSAVTVNIANFGSSMTTGSHFASVAVYKDNGNGVFDPATDLLAGSQISVNVGSNTVIATASNNIIDGGRFFVSLATSSAWTATTPADSIRVTLLSSGITTSVNSPTIMAVTTNTLTADTAVPTLISAAAQNTGSTINKGAGDSIVLYFSKPTNKPVITAANIINVLILNNNHSFLDGSGALGSASWNLLGTNLTISLSSNTSLPTVEIGDTVTVVGDLIKDTAGNNVIGSVIIRGSFGQKIPFSGTECANGLNNGQLYRVGEDGPVVLAAACQLKVFKGQAVNHAKGNKFRNIVNINNYFGEIINNGIGNKKVQQGNKDNDRNNKRFGKNKND